jgi:hypothetical protein
MQDGSPHFERFLKPPMDLERFRIAQADPAAGFDVAIAELQHGRKVSHWIWYIFPQLRGLGHSPTDIPSIHQMVQTALELAEEQGFPPCRETLILIQPQRLSHG